MNSCLAIVKKDMRRIRWMLLASIVAITTGGFILFSSVGEEIVRSWPISPIFMSILAPALLLLVTTSYIVHTDPSHGPQSIWRTSPIYSHTMFRAKLTVSIGVFISLFASLILPQYILHEFARSQWMYPLESAYFYGIIAVCALFLAAISKSQQHFWNYVIGSIVVFFACVFALSFFARDRSFPTFGKEIGVPIYAAILSGILAIAWRQYHRPNTKHSLSGIVIIIALLPGVFWLGSKPKVRLDIQKLTPNELSARVTIKPEEALDDGKFHRFKIGDVIKEGKFFPIGLSGSRAGELLEVERVEPFFLAKDSRITKAGEIASASGGRIVGSSNLGGKLLSDHLGWSEVNWLDRGSEPLLLVDENFNEEVSKPLLGVGRLSKMQLLAKLPFTPGARVSNSKCELEIEDLEIGDGKATFALRERSISKTTPSSRFFILLNSKRNEALASVYWNRGRTFAFFFYRSYLRNGSFELDSRAYSSPIDSDWLSESELWVYAQTQPKKVEFDVELLR